MREAEADERECRQVQGSKSFASSFGIILLFFAMELRRSGRLAEKKARQCQLSQAVVPSLVAGYAGMVRRDGRGRPRKSAEEKKKGL